MRLRVEGLVMATREGCSIRYGMGREETAVVTGALGQVSCSAG